MTPAISTEICPISGLRILRKPEWTDLDFGKTYRANIHLLGERIVVSRPTGYITLKGVKQSLALIESVVFRTVDQNRPYILIEDLFKLKGNSIEARRFYISHMKKQKPLLGLIFCNISTFSKISFKLAKRLNIAPFAVNMVDDYSDAVRLAVDTLERRFLPTETPGIVDYSLPAHAQSADEECEKKTRWGFDEMGFSVDLEIIHGNILHSVSRGFMTEAHIPMIEQSRQEMFESIQPNGCIDYFIASVSRFAGLNPKARILYMNSLKRWHERHPFKMFIFYGANRFMRTAANLARPFMSFKVRTAWNLDDALEMVALENQGAVLEAVERANGPAELESPEFPAKESYMEALLGYIANIRWDSEGPEFSEAPRPSHPLNSVFDAILLIKSELDHLFKEREAANKALREARDDLERRVSERTKELSSLNRTLNEEIVQHRKTLEELNSANGELRKTQSQLIQSAKLASIGELAAGVAHELNQPLMVIRTTVQLTRKRLKKRTLSLDETDGQLELVEKNTKRMMDIIDHLRLFSRQSTRNFERVDINRVIEEALLMIGEQLRVRGIAVKQELTKTLPMVFGNGNHLEQVILNLLTNAKDAMAECSGSEENRQRENVIEIKTGLSLTKPGVIEILIRDAGKGISPHVAQNIFDPFFTTKEVGAGSGQGLAIANDIIVNKHQGEITVTSTVGEGTIFLVRLPLGNGT